MGRKIVRLGVWGDSMGTRGEILREDGLTR